MLCRHLLLEVGYHWFESNIAHRSAIVQSVFAFNGNSNIDKSITFFGSSVVEQLTVGLAALIRNDQVRQTANSVNLSYETTPSKESQLRFYV